MIKPQDCKEQRRVYTRNKSGFWKVVAYCEEPTVTMENMLTGQRETFGISGTANVSYEEIGELPKDFTLLPSDKKEGLAQLRAAARTGI